MRIQPAVVATAALLLLPVVGAQNIPDGLDIDIIPAECEDNLSEFITCFIPGMMQGASDSEHECHDVGEHSKDFCI